MNRDRRTTELDDVLDDGAIDPTKEVITGTRWSTGAMALTQVVRIASQVVLTRLLFPGDFGIVTLAFTFAQFLDIFKDLGIATAIVQRPVVSYRLLNSLFWISVIFGLATSMLFIVASPLLAQGLDDGRAVGVFRLIGLSLFISSFGIVHQGVIRRRRHFRRMAMVTLTNGVVTAVSSVALAILGASVWSLAIGQVAGALASVVVAWQGSGFLVKLHLRLSDTIGVWGFSLSITAFNVANFFFLNADKLIVGVMFGEVALGLYRARTTNPLLPHSIDNSGNPVGSLPYLFSARRSFDPSGLLARLRRHSTRHLPDNDGLHPRRRSAHQRSVWRAVEWRSRGLVRACTNRSTSGDPVHNRCPLHGKRARTRAFPVGHEPWHPLSRSVLRRHPMGHQWRRCCLCHPDGGYLVPPLRHSLQFCGTTCSTVVDGAVAGHPCDACHDGDHARSAPDCRKPERVRRPRVVRLRPNWHRNLRRRPRHSPPAGTRGPTAHDSTNASEQR